MTEDGYEVPQNMSAERAVLGGILLEPLALPAVLSLGLEPGHFYADAHAIVFEAMVEMGAAAQPIDQVTLRDWIVGAGGSAKLARLGVNGVWGDEFLLGLTDVIPTIANIEAHARIVQEKATRRRLRQVLLRGAVRAVQGEIEDAHEAAREALGLQLEEREVVLQGRDCVQLALYRAPEAQATELAKAGFPAMDAAYRGLRRSTMAVLGGRTNSGKSLLMLAWALHCARTGLRPAIVSLEDAEDIWGERLAYQLVPTLNEERLRARQRDMDMQAEAAQALLLAERAGLAFAFKLNQPLRSVLRAVRALCKAGHRVIFVDYLQAIRFGVSGAKRAEVVSDAAQQLKAICQEFGAVLVLGSQTRRPDAAKPFAEPNAHELKESGDIENMAEVVIMLWKTSDESDAKHLGKVAKVKWSPRRPRFELKLAPNGALVDIEPYVPPAETTRGWGRA